MYRTAVVAGHLKEDGAIVFRGRISGDTQVKIRGLRIELSDIKSNILGAAEGILREATVTLREGDLLIAHVDSVVQQHTSDKTVFLETLLARLPLP